MIENPGKTPDFAIFASLNKRVRFSAPHGVLEPASVEHESICKSSRFSKGMPCERGHCSHWRGH